MELASDGGQTYTAYETEKFLTEYGVQHRLSSVAFPHSNQRAELAVKSMKRLLRENVGLDGKLNTDRFQRAVMQYRNTPDRDTGRSPAQVIFGRQLRDFLPAPLSRYKPQPEWLLLQDDRERALRKRGLRNTENLQHGTQVLIPLETYDTVQVQNQSGNNPSRWDITGTIVEVKDHDQYVVRVHGSGRVTLRNRKFLKKISPYCPSAKPIPPVRSTSAKLPSSTSHDQVTPQVIVQQDSHPVVQPRVTVESEPVPTEPLPSVPDQIVIPQQDYQPVNGPAGEPVLRRSTRTKVEPQRLNVESWQGKSYDDSGAASLVGPYAPGTLVHGNSVYYPTQPLAYSGITAPSSVGHTFGLHHPVPGGRGRPICFYRLFITDTDTDMQNTDTDTDTDC